MQRLGRMLGLVASVFALLTLLGQRPALACGNAVFSTDAAVATLHEAEAALDVGDVRTARELANKVLEVGTDYYPMGELGDRALHIRALSFVRDPSATEEDLEGAERMLRARHEVNLQAPVAISIDWGESLERLGRDKEAYDVLVPLADKDLIGSAYAYAALARAAKKHGDEPRTKAALGRCQTMASRPSMCEGKYPAPPLLRGRPLAYALPGLLFALTFVLRMTRGKAAPWRGFRAPIFVAVIVAAAGVAFAAPRSTALATFAALAAVTALAVVERRGFLSAVRGGKVPGFILRAGEPADANVPTKRLFFVPIAGETLERVDIDPSYRDSARRPLLRLERRSARGVAILLAVLLVLGAFAGCGSLFLLRSTKSASAPASL